MSARCCAGSGGPNDRDGQLAGDVDCNTIHCLVGGDRNHRLYNGDVLSLVLCAVAGVGGRPVCRHRSGVAVSRAHRIVPERYCPDSRCGPHVPVQSSDHSARPDRRGDR